MTAAASERGRGVPRRVWGGTGLLVLGRLFGSACTLAYLYLAAQRLSGPGFGRFTFYLALFLLLDSLADLGTGRTLVQRTASATPARLLGTLAATRRIRLASASLGVLLVAGGVLAAGEPGAGWIVLAALYPLTHSLELSTVVFQQRIAWSRPVLVRALAAGTSLSLVVLCYVEEVREPALYLLAVASGSTGGNLVLHLVSQPHLPRVAPERVPWRGVLAAALPLGIAGLFQQTYFYVDNLFVRAIAGPEPLGRYNIAVRFMSYGIMVAVYASQAALPWLAREHAAGRLGGAATRLAQPMFALAGLGTGLLWPHAERLLGLFGPEFAAAAPSLRWLLLATLAVYVGAAMVTAMVAAGRARALLAVSAAGLCVNLAGNALLVPRLSIEGAAIATCATEASVALAAIFVLRRSGVALEGRRALLWLGGPAAFLLARALSGSFS